ncbi:uncharacterized protein ACWYII_021842 [Salvelinus alpinus]
MAVINCSFCPVGPGGIGSLSEKVVQVATIPGTFTASGQSGLDNTLLLRRIGAEDDPTLEMDNKMYNLLAYQQANGSVGALSLPDDLNNPMEDRQALELLETRLTRTRAQGETC